VGGKRTLETREPQISPQDAVPVARRPPVQFQERTAALDVQEVERDRAFLDRALGLQDFAEEAGGDVAEVVVEGDEDVAVFEFSERGVRIVSYCSRKREVRQR